MENRFLLRAMCLNLRRSKVQNTIIILELARLIMHVSEKGTPICIVRKNDSESSVMTLRSLKRCSGCPRTKRMCSEHDGVAMSTDHIRTGSWKRRIIWDQ